MKIGVTSLGMRGLALPEAIQKMKQFGAECTELNGRPGCHPGLLWENEADFETAKTLFADAGIAVTSLGGYNDFAQFDDAALQAQVEGFIGYCRRAVRLGIPVVRAFAGDVKEGHALEDFARRITEAFVEVAGRVADLPVRIGIENHGRLANDGVFLRNLIETVASPKLGMTIDTGNFYWAGHGPETVDRFIRLLAPYTLNVHVKDIVYRTNQTVFVPAGRGMVDLPRLFRLLEAHGYAGAIVSEYEGEGTYDLGTLESVAYLRGLRDGLIKS